MSVIAARIYDDRIDVASDSIIVKGDLKRSNFQKVIQVDKFIAGGCGSAEELAMFLNYAKVYPQPDSADYFGIRNYIQNFYDKNNIEESENEYIVVFKGHVFHIDNKFILEVDEYTALGEGEPYALAAMHLDFSPRVAVETACNFCCNTSKPVQCFSVRLREDIV